LARPLRYTFILVLVAASATLAAVGGWRYARASAPVSGPILLVSIDALRADHLPVYGYRKIKTPAIDALGADGVIFDRAYSHAPQTLPAHASLLSGRLPFETGVRGQAGFAVNGAERMLAEILGDRGYATGAVVSSFALRRDTGIGQGFTFFDAELPPSSSEPLGEPLQRDGMVSERIAERWLDSIGTPRAFLFLHLAEPHKPYEPPERFAEYGPYDGEIAYADEIVGRLVRYLKTHQLYDQSTIILVSDHGEGLGDHGEREHGLFVYREAVRVPLIIKPAAGDGAGRRVSDVVQHVDLVPTILDLAKAPVPGNVRGQSLKSLLDGSGQLPPRTVYSESLFGHYHFGWTGLVSVTDGRYHFIKSAAEVELYDMEKDPAERRNIADDSAEVTAALSGALEELLAGTSIPESHEVSPEDRERFEALGYVGATIEPSPDADGAPVVAVVEAYRAAVDHDLRREWPEAIEILQGLLRDDSESADARARLAAVAERSGQYELAVDAHTRVIALRPEEASAYLGAATALWRLRRFDEARQHAERAASLAGGGDVRLRGAAHELLARIALGRRDAGTARVEADLAQQAEPGRPMQLFIEAHLLQEQRRYTAALSKFEQALGELGRTKGRRIADLHCFTADALARLYRYSEAEYHYLEELRYFPLGTRARAELAALYHTTERKDEAAEVLADLVRLTPTPEAFTLAARMWQTFGNPRQAASLRSEAQHRNVRSRDGNR
jgi:arylsulfatase A-like enzyme